MAILNSKAIAIGDARDETGREDGQDGFLRQGRGEAGFGCLLDDEGGIGSACVIPSAFVLVEEGSGNRGGQHAAAEGDVTGLDARLEATTAGLFVPPTVAKERSITRTSLGRHAHVKADRHATAIEDTNVGHGACEAEENSREDGRLASILLDEVWEVGARG